MGWCTPHSTLGELQLIKNVHADKQVIKIKHERSWFGLASVVSILYCSVWLKVHRPTNLSENYFSIFTENKKNENLIFCKIANVTDVNLVLKERTHKIKMKYSMNQYSNEPVA